MWELWNKKRYQDVIVLPSLRRFFDLVENGDLRPSNGQFIGEKIRYGQRQPVPSSGSNQQPQLAAVPQTNAKAWADVARACLSSIPDDRPSAAKAEKEYLLFLLTKTPTT